jgi:hypothetical protein
LIPLPSISSINIKENDNHGERRVKSFIFTMAGRKRENQHKGDDVLMSFFFVYWYFPFPSKHAYGQEKMMFWKMLLLFHKHLLKWFPLLLSLTGAAAVCGKLLGFNEG